MGNRLEELETKRLEVLAAIKPICEAFNLEYDYLVKTDGRQETLVLNGQKIGCSFNSIDANIKEIIGYLFVKMYCKDRWIGHFKTQTLNVIKQYWIK